MNENITYGFLGNNNKKYTNRFSEEWNVWYDICIVQSGEEILNSKIGTCFDQVELERLWFETHNYNFKTIFTWFELGRDSDLPCHTFLIYEKDGKWYWFEHAFENERGIHEFDDWKDAIKCVKEKQIEYASKNFDELTEKDKETLTFYEYTKPNNDLSIPKYFDHVTSNKKIEL
jgi:hypothetical protein